jgi:hypothetical protein
MLRRQDHPAASSSAAPCSGLAIAEMSFDKGLVMDDGEFPAAIRLRRRAGGPVGGIPA